jgi:hypothetical protein
MLYKPSWKTPKFKINRNAPRPARVRSPYASMRSIKRSLLEKIIFTVLLYLTIVLPRLLKLVFFDPKLLVLLTAKAFKEEVAAILKKIVSFPRLFMVFLRDRITVKDSDMMSLEKAMMIAWYVRKFSRHKNVITRRQYIILGLLPTVTQVILAYLGEPDAYDKKGNFALGIINKCTGNPLIVILPATITAYLADLTLFNTAEANMSSGLHTAREIRDNAWIVVKNHLLAIMAVAQLNSNNNTLSGITIIQSGGFGVKTVGAHEVHPFKAVNAGPGIMNISDAGAGDLAMHDWEYSLDGITWIAYMTTRHANMQATGLPQTTKVWFRTRARIEGLPIPVWAIIYVTVN